MVEISLSGSGEGSGWVTAPGYSTAGFLARSDKRNYVHQPIEGERVPHPSAKSLSPSRDLELKWDGYAIRGQASLGSCISPFLWSTFELR